MSTILEALDAMYEVKGDAAFTANLRNHHDTIDSKNRFSRKGIEKDPDSPIRQPMKTASDYHGRRRYADRGIETFNTKTEEEKRKESDRIARNYNKHRAKNECTETLDTLDLIL